MANKVYTISGNKVHLSEDNRRTLCGREVSNAGDQGDMCKRCEKSAALESARREMTSEALAQVNPKHPDVAAPVVESERTPTNGMGPAAPVRVADYTDAVVEMMRANGGQYVWGSKTYVHCHMTTSEVCAMLVKAGRARRVKLGTWELVEPAPVVESERVPTDVMATTRDGERITYAHIPNGDPLRVAQFVLTAVQAPKLCHFCDQPVHGATLCAPVVMHYGESRTLCGADPGSVGSAHCKGGDNPCPTACTCGCGTGEYECVCENVTTVAAQVTCVDCREGMHGPVHAPLTAVQALGVLPTSSTCPTCLTRPSTLFGLSCSECYAEAEREARNTPALVVTWRMIDATTGEPFAPGERESFRGETWRVAKITRTPEPGKEGKVFAIATYDGWTQELYPSVFGLRIVPKITPDMAGTWLDGCHGWTNSYRVIDIARGYGFTVPDDCKAALDAYRATGGYGMPDANEDVVLEQGGLVDKATEWLESQAPDGYTFVWDAGDFSLMTESDAEQF